jgi:hypothetical protein
MSFNPENSAIKVDAALEEKLKGASFEEIKAHLANAAVEQRLVVPDAYDASILLPVEQGTAPQKFAKAVIVNGVKHIIEGNSELELEKAESAFYRKQFEQPPVTHSEQPCSDHGRSVSDEDAAAQADLRLRIMRGETTVDQAVGEYLQAKGIPLEDLKASVAEKQNQRLAQSWEQSVEEFLKSPAGQDWPGGQENLKRIGQVLESNNLTDAEDKVAALAQAYEYLKSTNRLVANEEVEMHTRIANAKTPEEIRAALGRGSSTLWR